MLDWVTITPFRISWLNHAWPATHRSWGWTKTSTPNASLHIQYRASLWTLYRMLDTYPTFVFPPSTGIICPVVSRDPSLARNTITGPKFSLGSPYFWPIAIDWWCCQTLAASCSSFRLNVPSMYICVAIAERTAFTRILSFRQVPAAVLANKIVSQASD